MAEANQTEKATPQRRKKAREQGQVLRSRELPSLLALVTAVGSIMWMSDSMAEHWRALFVGLLGATQEGNYTAGGPVIFWCAVEVLRSITPILLLALMFSVGAALAQGGVNFAPAALSLKFERLSPSGGFGRIFSPQSVAGLLKSLVPFGAILLLGVNAIRDHWTELTRSAGEEVAPLASLVLKIVLSVLWKSGLVLLAWAAVDYGLLWQQHEKQLRMTREQVKQEHKETDGNPQTKGQRRRLQRAMRRRHSMKAVATATLVVTNPTHFAVALLYDAKLAAPEVVAKGRDLVAQRIKQAAFENNVPVMENKPLAQALFKNVEVGDAIPAQLYQAVAEILVMVYKAEAELRERERQKRRLNAAGEEVIWQ